MDSVLTSIKSIKIPEPQIDLSLISNKLYELNEKAYKLEELLKYKAAASAKKKVIMHRATHQAAPESLKNQQNPPNVKPLEFKIECEQIEPSNRSGIGKEIQISELSLSLNNLNIYSFNSDHYCLFAPINPLASPIRFTGFFPSTIIYP